MPLYAIDFVVMTTVLYIKKIYILKKLNQYNMHPRITTKQLTVMLDFNLI